MIRTVIWFAAVGVLIRSLEIYTPDPDQLAAIQDKSHTLDVLTNLDLYKTKRCHTQFLS